jgi:hypothetical protein
MVDEVRVDEDEVEVVDEEEVDEVVDENPQVN